MIINIIFATDEPDEPIKDFTTNIHEFNHAIIILFLKTNNQHRERSEQTSPEGQISFAKRTNIASVSEQTSPAKPANIVSAASKHQNKNCHENT